MKEKQVYSNAPIVFAAVEVHHSPCRKFSSRDVSIIDAMLQGEAIWQHGTEEKENEAHQWISADNQTALIFSRDYFAVQTTNYKGHEKLFNLARLAFLAQDRVEAPESIKKIELRYIDEVRAPFPQDEITIDDWKPWISSYLLGPSFNGEIKTLDTKLGASLFTFRDFFIILKYGPLQGHIKLNVPLERLATPDTPFFLIDMNSLCEAPAKVPEWDLQSVCNAIEELHLPLRDMFESLITNKLREEVLNRK
ncbi:TIGR04255 family protein [Actinomycetaceae bacterium TAE3-ERU4]|nr:TIGR04255 family protein [Actinomycetaceae bacterium TAE3-ERU4]